MVPMVGAPAGQYFLAMAPMPPMAPIAGSEARNRYTLGYIGDVLGLCWDSIMP